MRELEVIKILQEELKFTDQSIDKLKMLEIELLNANKKHNFIAKSTEDSIWSRHILDSAQLVKYINFKQGSLSDLGSGAGFPGLVLAIYNQNFNFHVKLYEKSQVKRNFLNEMIGKLKLKATLFSNVFGGKIESLKKVGSSMYQFWINVNLEPGEEYTTGFKICGSDVRVKRIFLKKTVSS